MSLEKAREYKKKYGLEDKIMEFPVLSATVEELIGHAVGGVCPFEVNENVDDNTKDFQKKTAYTIVYGELTLNNISNIDN